MGGTVEHDGRQSAHVGRERCDESDATPLFRAVRCSGFAAGATDGQCPISSMTAATASIAAPRPHGWDTAHVHRSDIVS